MRYQVPQRRRHLAARDLADGALSSAWLGAVFEVIALATFAVSIILAAVALAG